MKQRCLLIDDELWDRAGRVAEALAEATGRYVSRADLVRQGLVTELDRREDWLRDKEATDEW
jgi:Arc/MetJ-type ribon-helix-helix transcriptional regulator